MTRPDSNRLTDELDRGAHRFDELGGRDLDLSEVLGRARGIRHRRRAGVALAAAAVLAAVAVPVGLSAGGTTTAPPLPASSVTPRPIQRIALDDLPVGAAPTTGWVDGHTWHAADGKVLAVNPHAGDVRGIAPVGDGAVVSMAHTDGALWAWFLHDDGTFEELASPIEGGLVRSPDGRVVAFVGSHHRATVVLGARRHTALRPTGHTGSLSAAAVTGEDCSATGPGCVVWLNDLGRSPWTLPVASGAAADLAMVPRIETLADVASDGHKAGIVSRTDAGTCSEVQDGGGHRLWRTCDARFLTFSPDGTRLLGTAAYGDGLGDTRLSVFDAATGRAQLDLPTARGAVITQMVWEDDTHVLAAVSEGGRAAIVRLGLDGRAEYAVAPVPQHDDVNPFVLPAS